MRQCVNITSLPDSFGSLSNLQRLEMADLSSLTCLPGNFGRLINLRSLEMGWCSNVARLSDSFGRLCSLQQLNLTACTKSKNLPAGFSDLSNLQRLTLDGCRRVTSVPDSLSNLQYLSMNGSPLPTSFAERFRQPRSYMSKLYERLTFKQSNARSAATSCNMLIQYVICIAAALARVVLLVI